ncbi:NCS2 family permease [Anaerotignum lactatifermentans]|uniref:NCS2 family permease n=1 Tax=Anaerotignum lactatifermentans TaxID=160404 RepID=A0ABS2G5Y7_9FIRM|nr:NCS2 family permease [Anaerotignum lactatifermentans]MBM6828992.1 NCS2 family permease [Anaerotignum lactatifermentans]MBM6876834.1 NCS2 family permease [Anaerotignum lactatifermentans]MBM6950393.1 NCS2 family permease [Anaerotignum lactatifermentans]
MHDLLEKTFHLKKHQTNVKTEILAGVTTFMTMAYILAVNPSILSASGMDSGAIFTATALSSCLATLMMAFFSNYPFALAPGMGLNAFFAYTVVGQMGYSWQVALGAVFIEGLIFILLSVTNVREAIFNCIPASLKMGITCGIGLFIAFIGLQNAKLVVDSSTLVSIYPFHNSLVNGTFSPEGVGALLAFIGILITAVLICKKVPGGILLGIFCTWFLGIICQLTGIYQPAPELGMGSVLPDFSTGLHVPSLAPTFLKMDFSGILSLNVLTIMLSFLFVDLFDTMGTLIGVASKADMLDENGNLPRIRGALLSDAIGTSLGAILGTSTVSSYVESSSGVMAGGRTGLTSVVTALLFALSLFLSPIFLAIPSFATAPAMIIVGFMMLEMVVRIDFSDMTEAIPAFITIIAMPFMYSISEGIALGVISYVVIQVAAGKAKEKKIHWIIYALAIAFILKYIFV